MYIFINAAGYRRHVCYFVVFHFYYTSIVPFAEEIDTTLKLSEYFITLSQYVSVNGCVYIIEEFRFDRMKLAHTENARELELIFANGNGRKLWD